jgi:glycerol uptake facilitator protein
MEANYRTYLLELVGTYLLVFIGAGTLCTTYLTSFQTVGGATLAVALAEGLTLAAVLSFTTLVSPACCNPAITLSLWLTGKLPLFRAAGLGTAQLMGSFLAGLSVRLLFAESVLENARLGTPHLGAILGPGDELSLGAWTTGMLLEIFFGFVISLVIFSTLLDPRRPPLGALLVGLAQVAIILFGFHLTGGSANPARWFGPALWQLSVTGISQPLAQHSIYWAGPLLGAMAGTVFYSLVLSPSVQK